LDRHRDRRYRRNEDRQHQPAITVNVGVFAKLQVLVPGESAAPGTVNGKTGTPTAQTAGTAFTVTVNAWTPIGI